MDDNGQKPESGSDAEKRNTPAAFPIAAAFIGVIFFLIVGMAIYRDEDKAWSYGINLFTSVISTIATVGIIEAFSHQREKRETAEREEENRRRDERNAVLARQQQLIDDAASNVNDVAKNAVYQMRRRGWLRGENGLLKGADLSGANLQGANLDRANLQGANLHRANLQAADLGRTDLQAANLAAANLQAANLRWANLQGADLDWANLQAAELDWANLQGADLQWANLQAANLAAANLQAANLYGANFDAQTGLPDISHWTPETDMDRFTSPKHPKFWRSYLPDSPDSRVYRVKDWV